MSLDTRVEALIRLVDEECQSQCRARLSPAHERAATLLADARLAAQARVHAAIAEERAAFSMRVARAEARLATRQRMARQRLLQALLVEGRAALAHGLAERWRDPALRKRWVEAALERAAAALPPEPWRVNAPADWPAAERDEVLASLAKRGIHASIEDDPAIEAGVRATAGHVTVDATLAGLTADRAAIDARLLLFIDEASA